MKDIIITLKNNRENTLHSQRKNSHSNSKDGIVERDNTNTKKIYFHGS